MQNVKVEVFEDTSRPDGGHAVLLLHGVSSLPDRVQFRLKPVDSRVMRERRSRRELADRRSDAGGCAAE